MLRIVTIIIIKVIEKRRVRVGVSVEIGRI